MSCNSFGASAGPAMIEVTVELLRAPLVVLGFSGLLIGLGLILSDRRRSRARAFPAWTTTHDLYSNSTRRPVPRGSTNVTHEPWPAQPSEEHELQKDKDQYYRERGERAFDVGSEGGGSYREHTPGSSTSWWLTAVGIGLFVIGVGLPILRVADVWRPPECAISGTTGAQQALGTIIVLLAVPMVVFGVLCLLWVAARRFASLARRSRLDEARTVRRSYAYACFLAIGAGLGVIQILVLANSLQCAGSL